MPMDQKLKQLRAAKGLTQYEMACQLNVTRQTISSYESGRIQPDVDTLKRLAALYSVSLDDLIYDRDDGHSRVKFLLILLLGYTAASVPWLWLDPVFGFWNYLASPMNSFVFAVLAAAIGWTVEQWLGRRKK